MKLVGHPPINPVLFYTGKFSGYFVWGVWIISALGTDSFVRIANPGLQALSFVAFGLGVVIVTISLFNLGSATRLGLPDENTELKTRGLYQLSRHPMYVGFHLFTLAAVIYTMSPVVMLAGAYSVLIYHQIIKAEEAFLEQRFGDAYREYSDRVGRYF